MDEKRYKIVLAGKYGVGKTKIFEKLQSESKDSVTKMRTVEVTGTDNSSSLTGHSVRGDRAKWTVSVSLPNRDGTDVTVVLWDTGQMEQHGIKNMTRSYFADSGPVGVILVYDTGDLESLNCLRDWISAAREYNGSTGSSVLFSLWGNDMGNNDNPVDNFAAQDFARGYDIFPKLIFTVNASTGYNLIDSFQRVIDALHLTNTNPRRVEEWYGDIVDLQRPNSDAPQSKWSKCVSKC